MNGIDDDEEGRGMDRVLMECDRCAWNWEEELGAEDVCCPNCGEEEWVRRCGGSAAVENGFDGYGGNTVSVK